MKYKMGRSTHQDVQQSINEAIGELKHPKLILFFSSVRNFDAYTIGIKEKFPNCLVIGSTTFASFCKEGISKEGILVLGIEEGIECYGDVLEEVDQYPIKYVPRIEACVESIGTSTNTMCLTFTTGLISCEELVLSTLNSVLNPRQIPIFGGTAGDEGKAEKTLVSYNGKVYEKACIFVLLKNLGGKIHFYQENIYKPTAHHFIATKVDVRNRIVYEYDGKSAASQVAQALGTDLQHLPSYLDSYPMGRMIGNDMYITANKEVVEQKGMAYHARVYKNSQMVLLEPDNYKNVIKQTMERIHQDVPKPSFALVVHCLARSLLFESQGYLDQFAREMGQTLGNYVGFAGYGEQLDHQHFNQTMIIAVFE